MTPLSKLAHIAAIPLDPTLGMGRIAVHWRDAFIRRGWNYSHYGTNEVPVPKIKALWSIAARRALLESGKDVDILLAHEPSAAAQLRTGLPTVLFSHGLEERHEALSIEETDAAYRGLKSLLAQPFWAHLARQKKIALSQCPLLLLSNQDDQTYVLAKYSRKIEDTFVFNNGVNPSSLQSNQVVSAEPTILFYGSWLERKGKSVLIKAAIKLAKVGIKPRWLLIGTGKSEETVLKDWPLELHKYVSIKSKVSEADDDLIYSQATVFVLPSYFEGQPLTLLQAMESGRCVITTRCCGQKDVIKNAHNGFMFEPGNSEELAHLISDALKSEDLRFKLGFNAKKAMSSRSWESVSNQVVDRLERLLH